MMYSIAASKVFTFTLIFYFYIVKRLVAKEVFLKSWNVLLEIPSAILRNLLKRVSFILEKLGQ